MRRTESFATSSEKLPDVPEVLAFVAERSGLRAKEAYATLNMGVGFACYVGRARASRWLPWPRSSATRRPVAGVVEEGEKSVVLDPIAVTYGGDELELH